MEYNDFTYFADCSHRPIDIINDWNLDFNLGNAIKYIFKASRTNEEKIEDLQTAVNYLKYTIELEKEKLWIRELFTKLEKRPEK